MVEKYIQNDSAVVAALHQVSQSIDKAGDLSKSSISLVVISAVSTAIAAYIFTFIQWKLMLGRERRLRRYEAMNSLIDRLDEELVEYWMRNQSDRKDQENGLSEIRIKTDLKLLNRTIIKYYETFFMCGKFRNKENINQAFSDVFELATGDDFEVKTRKSCKKTAHQISNKLADIRVKILSDS